ncbi:MAG: hypothetical protein Athens101410_711 [Parcubacteria group bacterium Athens1014_10]|nr:MAG: hypothetical protein Athens101410_711 [Parcubacteria group bacterium Athens1014_10]TSD04696.1 MAG: hypothetical protein Athens071412_691 [Parcubacteria group bacterium Athens0714_12]
MKKTIYFQIFSLVFAFIFLGITSGKASYYLKDSELLKPLVPQATLKLSYNDGIVCFINNQLVINALEEDHNSKYWNRELDVYKYLKIGLNLIACRVSNGDGNKGKSNGKFDAELIINGEEIITRGDNSNCYKGAIWRYYGKAESRFHPPKEKDGDYWYRAGYSDSSWNFGYPPFGEEGSKKNCTEGILSKAPDDAWFRKWFDVIDLNVYKIDPQESVVSQLIYPAPALIRLGENSQVDMSIVYITKSLRPVITGLVKYDSRVKIYIDNKYVNLAKIQNGEKSGTANFYYYPYLKKGKHTYFAVAQNKTTGATSFPSKLITFEIK